MLLLDPEELRKTAKEHYSKTLGCETGPTVTWGVWMQDVRHLSWLLELAAKRIEELQDDQKTQPAPGTCKPWDTDNCGPWRSLGWLGAEDAIEVVDTELRYRHLRVFLEKSRRERIDPGAAAKAFRDRVTRLMERERDEILGPPVKGT